MCIRDSVYILETPLFRVRNKKKTMYCYDDEERNTAVKELGKKGLDTSRIRRLWIPLTEPKLGHALFVGNDVAYNLKRGTVLTFDKNILHSGCNVGYEDRYVLTLTGYYG